MAVVTRIADGRGRPICMIVHSYYEEDPRVRREAESLVASGHEVDVIALRQPGDEPSAIVDGVNVRRLGVQRHQGAGVGTYLREYVSFLVRASLALVRAHRRRRYRLVHVHSLPDFLVLAALPLRLARVPVILDLHEAMPDFFRMRFPRLTNPAWYRLLLIEERFSIACANAVITVNDALADRLVRRGIAPAKVTVLRNSPSLLRFDRTAFPERRFMADGTLRLVYAGALTPTYELDSVLRAVARLMVRRSDLPITLAVYGRGDSEPGLHALAADLGLADRVAFPGRIPIADVPAALAAADIGLAPTRRDPFTDTSLSTKIFEYGAMGKPVVASRLPLVERVFAAGTVRTYEPGDDESLADAIVALVDEPEARMAAVAATLERVRELAWEREAGVLTALVDRMTRPGLSSAT